MTKADILDTLEAFVHQRPGLEPDNYDGHPDLYRRDYREGCLQPLHDFRELVEAVRWRDSLSTDDLREAFRRAFGGRLDLHDDGSLEYTSGQYGALEYRRAACAVLAAALWTYRAEDLPPASADTIRQWAVNEFGRGIARRWFDA